MRAVKYAEHVKEFANLCRRAVSLLETHGTDEDAGMVADRIRNVENRARKILLCLQEDRIGEQEAAVSFRNLISDLKFECLIAGLVEIVDGKQAPDDLANLREEAEDLTKPFVRYIVGRQERKRYLKYKGYIHKHPFLENWNAKRQKKN